MAPKFALFIKGSKLPLNKGFKNMFELLQSCDQPSIYNPFLDILDSFIMIVNNIVMIMTVNCENLGKEIIEFNTFSCDWRNSLFVFVN